MSGRHAARDAIREAAKRESRRHRSVRRGTITAVKPIVVKLHSYEHPLTQDDDLFLSGWARFYEHVVGFQVDDMVLVQQEHSDWILMDMVTDSGLEPAFDAWSFTHSQS